MTRTKNRARRAGFTLIELLVVISIIAVLISLTTAAVMKMFVKGPEAVARAEIDQLSSSVGGFKAHFTAAKMVPSQFILSEQGYADVPASQLKTDSMTFLGQMFGNNFNPSTPIDWNNNGTTDAATTLTGDQCLVFFLGGPPMPGTTPGCQGFSYSTAPFNPALPPQAQGESRHGPFFDFKPNRLIVGANGYYSYADAFTTSGNQGAPYLYFSSWKTANSYNRYGASDCPLMAGGPYYSGVSPTGLRNYFNPSGFQIISAGANGTRPGGGFGPGGALTQPLGGAGADDFCNFSRARLGTSISP